MTTPAKIDTARVRETCHVAGGSCLNPAAVMCSAGYAVNAPRTSVRCTACDEVVCAECRIGRRGSWVCDDCVEDADRKSLTEESA